MSYTSTKITSLATKIEAYFNRKQNTPHYVNTKVMADDVQYNLSPIIAELLVCLMPQPLPKTEIERIIDDYNTANNTSYTFDYFFFKGWIRFINGDFKIASAIQSEIWKVQKPGLFNRNNHPVEFEPEIRCLSEVEMAIKESKKTTIDETEVLRIIRQYSPDLTAGYLVDNLLMAKATDGRYYWNRNEQDYTRSLIDRIVSRAWTTLMGNAPTLDKFRTFVNLIACLNTAPDQLAEYLPHETMRLIRQYALEILNTEEDLKHPELEVRNDKLDGDHLSRHGTLADPPRTFVFDTADQYKFYKQLEHFRKYETGLLTHDNSRGAYGVLIKFLFQIQTFPEPYAETLKFYKECKNPFVKAKMLMYIRYCYPETLAYFFADLELAVIAFNVLEELDVQGTWISTDEGFPKTFAAGLEIKNDLWNEAFDLLVERAAGSQHPDEYAACFAAILGDLTLKVFTFNGQNQQLSATKHKLYFERYDRVLDLLKNARRTFVNHYPKPKVLPLLVAYLLEGILNAIKSFPEFSWKNELISLPNARIDLLTEMLKLASLDFGGKQAFYGNPPDQDKLSEAIAKEIYEELHYYFTVDEEDFDRYTGTIQRLPVKRYGNEFGTEIVDYAFVFINLQKHGFLQMLWDEFEANLRFDAVEQEKANEKSKRDDLNKEQGQKAAALLKIFLVAFIGISERKDQREFDNLPVQATLDSMATFITTIASRFAMDDPANGKMDIFSSNNYYFSRQLYSQELDSLLYQAMNHFPEKDAVELIDEYFKDSEDLEKLFTAVNRIENPKIENLLTKKIESINCEKFIESTFWVPDVESTLVEIANSRSLFRFAGPFLEAIEEHAASRQVNTPDKQLFLYRIKLLLALKNKDTQAIIDLAVPKLTDLNNTTAEAEQNRKEFYIGLDLFYNQENYEAAVERFQGVYTFAPQNVEYAAYVYYAKTLRDWKAGELGKAKTEWDAFAKAVKNTDDLKPISAMAESMDLLYYIADGDDIRFDQIVNTLPPAYLYQNVLVKPVYQRYVSRGMSVQGYYYLVRAIEFAKSIGVEVSEELETLKLDATDDKVLEKVTEAVSALRNLHYKSIPIVIPKILNGKNKPDEFILGEFVNGIRVMRQKVKAVESIVKEDHYNDVFLATLRLRLPVFGWEIVDQMRTGPSASGKDAGEADIVLVAAGNVIALLESLRMSGKDITNLQLHLKKCAEYNRDLPFYFVMVYYIGERDNFNNFITTYQSSIKGISFESDWEYDEHKGFVDLTGKFDNVENLHIGKTIHGPRKLQLFHLLVDMSKGPVLKDDHSK